MGSPGFIDPYQLKLVRGGKTLTQELNFLEILKCDIFALGCTLYFMIMGSNLIDGENNEEILNRSEHFTPAAKLDLAAV